MDQEERDHFYIHQRLYKMGIYFGDPSSPHFNSASCLLGLLCGRVSDLCDRPHLEIRAISAAAAESQGHSPPQEELVQSLGGPGLARGLDSVVFSDAVSGFGEMSVPDNRLPCTYSVCVCPRIVQFRIGVPCKYSFCY